MTLGILVPPVATRIANRDPAAYSTAEDQGAAERRDAGNERCEQRRQERRAEVCGAELGRGDDDSRSKRRRPDDAEEHPTAGAKIGCSL